MNNIYNRYLKAINNHETENIIYKIFLNNQSNEYLENTVPKRQVIDFIAGMTDELFLEEIKR